MKIAVVHSVCECQARLGAEVDEHHVATRGWAKHPRRGDETVAPANTTRSHGTTQFDVGWLCPFCGRNTLRPFDSVSLAFREAKHAS